MTTQYEPGVLYDWASSDMPALPLDAEVALFRGNLLPLITQACNANWRYVVQFIVLKPARKPREFWVNYYGNAGEDIFHSEEAAKKGVASGATEIAVCFEEKLK